MQKTSALALLSGERTLRALQLRKEGQTFVEIGADLGVTPQAAFKRVAKVLSLLAEEVQEQREELRTLEAQRLDDLQQACWDMAMRGNLRAIDQVLRIMDRRARLFDLGTPPPPQGFGLEDLVERVREVMQGYKEPMPPDDDDGMSDWPVAGAQQALTDFIEVEPERSEYGSTQNQ